MPPRSDRPRPLLIALTGGIGAGKSTVAGLLAELGAWVIDTDKVAHETYRRGTDGFNKVVASFGKEIVAPDGSIDRRRLAQVVFTDPDARQRLNSIVHPLVAAEVQRRVAEHRQGGGGEPIVLEIPLLVESGGVWAVDQVWVVTAERETAIARLVERGLQRAEAQARIDSQAQNEERLEYASVVIENDGTVEQLRRRVLGQWRKLTAAGT